MVARWECDIMIFVQQELLEGRLWISLDIFSLPTEVEGP